MSDTEATIDSPSIDRRHFIAGAAKLVAVCATGAPAAAAEPPGKPTPALRCDVKIRWDEKDEKYVATMPEIDCEARGDTYEAALAGVCAEARTQIEAAKDEG